MLMNTYARMPVRFVSGRGARLTDDAGRSYIDFLAGIAVASVGHAHPLVAAAIAEQAAALIHVSNFFSTIPQERFATELAELTGGMHSFFCNSGAESIEAALKLARKHGRARGRDATRIVCADGGFHGRTFGALSATGQPSKQAPFEPLVGGFVHVPYGDAAALEEVMGDDVAAVLLEPIQGEAGVIIPPPGYLAAARKLCDETGALLILDEVQTGLGRTGAWFAWEHEGVSPDVMCLAKALAGGLPMGACLATPEASAFVPGDHATTFGGGSGPKCGGSCDARGDQDRGPRPARARRRGAADGDVVRGVPRRRGARQGTAPRARVRERCRPRHRRARAGGRTRAQRDLADHAAHLPTPRDH